MFVVVVSLVVGLRDLLAVCAWALLVVLTQLVSRVVGLCCAWRATAVWLLLWLTVTITSSVCWRSSSVFVLLCIRSTISSLVVQRRSFADKGLVLVATLRVTVVIYWRYWGPAWARRWSCRWYCCCCHHPPSHGSARHAAVTVQPIQLHIALFLRHRLFLYLDVHVAPVLPRRHSR